MHFQILQLNLFSPFNYIVQDLRSGIHTNRNLVSIHLSAVHIHCNVLVFAYVKTLHCLRLVDRTEMDVGPIAIVAVLQQYVATHFNQLTFEIK